jgi:hypothetical protein
MQGSVESVQQPSSEDGIIGIMHVNNIKGYVFCSWVLWGAKGDRQGYDPNYLNSFATKVI